MTQATERSTVEDVLERVRLHGFHPVDHRNFTLDRDLLVAGIADLDDPDWRVRLLAIRDLVRAGSGARDTMREALRDNSFHVRYVVAKAAGIRRDGELAPALERALQQDPNALVRAQAAMSLGQIGAAEALETLQAVERTDTRDVRHQAELAIGQIDRSMPATDALEEAYASIDPATFDRVEPGDAAPGFELPDTTGRPWRLDRTDAEGAWTLLVWVFADWCPVCHREFDELIELRDRFADLDVEVATIECHDTYRGRTMVGQELEPDYWFAEASFTETYTERIWWPHLLDRAGRVGATYGVDPLAFAVHAEYINRPATVVVDPDGIVRLAYIGTFWGDRPSIEETLDMIEAASFGFEHPDRRTRRT